MTNYTEAFDKVFAQTETWMKPMVSANQMAVTNFEKIVSFQMKALQKYVDMGLDQMKAAAEVDSPKAFQAYMGKQMETANTVRQHMMDDFKALTEMGNDIKEDYTKLAENSVQDMKEAVNKTTKKAA